MRSSVSGAGIDIGSTSIKLATMSDFSLACCSIAPASSDPLAVARELLRTIPSGVPVVATGYGRDLVACIRSVSTVTEIKAHALGARYLVPDCRGVIDVGGQDLKTIALDACGKVCRFEMNDRCAAGTGRFLDVMSQRLGYSIEEFAAAARNGSDTLTISAQCTVFAESEVVGLMNRGCKREDIARALHASVVKRIVAQFYRTGPIDGTVLLTGGGARNSTLHERLSATLGRRIQVADRSPFAGAIGCAVVATKPVLQNSIALSMPEQ